MPVPIALDMNRQHQSDTSPGEVPGRTHDPAKLRVWADRLERLAVMGDAELPADPRDYPGWIAYFKDEAGHRRAVDPLLLAFRIRQSRNPSTPAFTPLPAVSTEIPEKPDLKLWRSLLTLTASHRTKHHGTTNTDSNQPNDAGVKINDIIINNNTPQPATLGTPSGAIEVWTETDLCALHALGWLATLSTCDATRAAIRDRVRLAVIWHLEHIQPDNATNHPWAVHLFAAAGCEHDSPHASEADLFAQTLAHNSLVSMGRPDRISAHILADAAAWMRSASRSTLNDQR